MLNTCCLQTYNKQIECKCQVCNIENFLSEVNSYHDFGHTNFMPILPSLVITDLNCLETTVADQAVYIDRLECNQQDLLDQEDVNEMKRQHATVVRQVGREADKGFHSHIIKEHRGWVQADVNEGWTAYVTRRTIDRWNAATVSVLVLDNEMTADEKKARKKDRKRRKARRGLLVDSTSSTDETTARNPRAEPSIRRNLAMKGPRSIPQAPPVTANQVKLVLDSDPVTESSTLPSASDLRPSTAILPTVPSASAVVSALVKKSKRTTKVVQKVVAVTSDNIEFQSSNTSTVTEPSTPITNDPSMNPTGSSILLQSPISPVKSNVVFKSPVKVPGSGLSAVKTVSFKRKLTTICSPLITSPKRARPTTGNKQNITMTSDTTTTSAASGMGFRSKYFWCKTISQK